ncbi:MAG TPA: hypothetical protein VKB75_13265, partial [Jatrophihabitans sp.]|nr:hypothetical protein [Jatrophihabitans sp.]
MFVHVVAMLVVAMPLVHVVDVVAVLDGVAAVVGHMAAVVHRVDCLFAMVFGTVHMVDVVAVLHGVAAIARQMFVIGLSGMFSHRILLRRPLSTMLAALQARQERPRRQQRVHASAGTRARPNGRFLSRTDSSA